MPIQAATQWTEYLNCPVCENGFDIKVRQPISLGCGHTICKTCLFNLQRNQCPFDLGVITVEVERLPINTALMLLIDSSYNNNNNASSSKQTSQSPPFPSELESYRNSSEPQVIALMKIMESLALFLKPSSSSNSLSRSMQRKLITLINCQLMEDEGRLRAARAARSLGERTVTELILHHQNPQQLSANLWAAVRGRGCQFLGPAMQEEVLKLVLLALEDGEALSRKVLVMYVVQRLESQFPQASKTSIGHVVQLLYRASCFKVTKREGDSSLMQLKEEFRTYDALRREHDMQIVQIATEAGLRIAPDQWSSLLYGDSLHKSQMQSIMDKLQTPESFSQSVQELVIALQKTGDPGKLTDLRPSLDFLAGIDPAQDTFLLMAFVNLHSNSKRSTINANVSGSGNASLSGGGNPGGGMMDSRHHHHIRYKTKTCVEICQSMDLVHEEKKTAHLHTLSAELEQHRNSLMNLLQSLKNESGPFRGRPPPNAPVAQVAPLPRVVKQCRQGTAVVLPPASNPPPLHHPHQSSINSGGHIQFHVLSDAYGNPVPYQHSSSTTPSPVIQLTTPPQHFHPFINGGGRGGGGGDGMELSSTEDSVSNKQMSTKSSSDSSCITIPIGESGNEELLFKNNVCQLDEEIVSKSIARIATKSLSALQSRKEEIIDTLEDLMGKDEASKLSLEFEELSFQNKASQNSSGLEQQINTTNVIIPSSSYDADPSAAAVAHEQAVHDGLENQCTVNHHEKEEKGGRYLFQHGVSFGDDDIHPLPDVPLVSRFGPISRRCNTLLKPSNPSQTQASMDDGTVPTDVVTNAKQMTHQIPSITSPWYYQNGIMSVQPVAVGPNGEFGYIVVADQAQSTPVILQNPLQSVLASEPDDIDRYNEEKECLKICGELSSDIFSSSSTSSDSSITHDTTITFSNCPNTFDPSSNGVNLQIRQDQLSNELFLIENSIRDREREISINHMQELSISHHRGALDYGSYISQGLISTEEEDSGLCSYVSLPASTTGFASCDSRDKGRTYIREYHHYAS
ncbi:RC3H [Lepeophtheirus salmonis]|uniref:RING-type E3 ubiquitin transferase n=1 Tax=Lepeophtheirus salmonis TaxID=72036 RepID=A0A7R8CD26_LEPSM|nr:RC3H [Lepeophtheirus salmonis]CAF2776895.1 RC3H [Lepeophtheirus salmonis]